MNPLNQARSLRRRLLRERFVGSINGLLSSPGPTDTGPAERDFELLRATHAPPPEYGYDGVSLARRASQRMADVFAQLAPSDARLTVLDVGAGDGVMGALFAAAGHQPFLCDLRDWRTPPAASLPFAEADCCVSLPYADAMFDVVTSFNSFEHMSDPARAFAEIARVAKPGGLIHLDFGPLYCSPWGLHAYRSLPMPYPQFLFSSAFTHEKLSQIGIRDLGEDRDELQPLNGWKAQDFVAAWDASPVRRENMHFHVVEDWLGLVKSYPSSFRGRGLVFEDLVRCNIIASFRRL